MLQLLADTAPTSLSDDQFNRLLDLAQSHSGHVTDALPLTAVTLSFATPIIIVLALLWYRARRQARQHEVILKLAELGQPVPPQLFIAEPMPRRGSELGRALTLIAVGIAIGIWLYTNGNADEAGFALIPLLVGVARLIAWKVERPGVAVDSLR